MSGDNDQKGKKKFPIRICQKTMTKMDEYISNKLLLQNHSVICIDKSKSLLSAASILSRSHMAHNITVSLEKLPFTDYMDFGKFQDRLGQKFWSKNDFNYLTVELEHSQKNDNKAFRLVENASMERQISTFFGDYGINYCCSKKL